MPNRFVLSLLAIGLAAASVAHTQAQESDVASLVHPEVAERLSLADSQRAQIQALLQSRAEALAASTDKAAKEKTKSEFKKKILDILTAEQQAKFVETPSSKRLMFQFREMKWDDVLDWFAGQQDLTLVMDQIPPGTFTYSDTRSYSPSEGIDLLNSVLMTRNFTLVRREKMLVVMALSDSIPLELLPRVKLDELVQRGRFELVSVLFPTGGRSIEAVLQEVKPFLSTYGRVVPLAQGTQVLVVETAGKMQTINEIIASVPLPKQTPKPEPPPPPPKPVFASYPLGNLDAARALETIRKLIPSEQITVDAKTGVLSAFLIPDQHNAVKSSIAQMIASSTQLPSFESVAYPLPIVSAEEAKRQVASLEKQILSLAPNASVSATADRILILARPEEQKLIKASLAALDIVPVDGASKSMKVFELEPAIAAPAEAALKSFLPKGQIASNSKTGNLIVRGSEDDLRIASEMIEIFKKSQTANQLKMQVFPLEQVADAKWLATLQRIVPNANAWLGDDGRQLILMAGNADIAIVDSMLPQLMSVLPKADQRKLQIYALSKSQMSRRSSLLELPPVLKDIKVVEGSNKQEILVWATTEQHAEFSRLLEGLDQPAPNPIPSVPKTYPIEVQDSPLVVQILAAEFPEAKITIDPDGLLITALADEKSHLKIASRIASFNEQLPKKTAMTLETYAVRGMTAAALQQSLAAVLTKARVNVDTVKNRLLVTADAKTHLEISNLVAALAEKPDVDHQQIVMAYPIENAVPTQVKLVFDQLALGAVAIADDKLKQLVVTGTLEAQAIAKSMIAQIDKPTGLGGQKEIRSYDAKKLQAAALLPTMQKLWPDMQLSVDTVSNRIIASGNAKELDQLAVAIERLISAPDGKVQSVSTYPVPAGDMLSLAAILGQIAPQAIISSDIPSRTVTVWANEEQQTRVQQALEQISKTAQAAKEASTYLLKPTQVAAVQASLQSLFPTIGVASVPATGQLIVIASPEQQKKISQVIELMASGPNAMERTIQVFRVDPEQVDLLSLFSSLQATVPSQIRMESNPANNTILAIGSPEELQLVSAKVDELKKQMPAPEPVTSAVYQLKHATTAGAIAILQPLVPKATLVQDAATRSIAATAKATDHRKIVDLLAMYDLPSTSDSETRVFSIGKGNANSLRAALQGFSLKATATADTATNSLIVTAPSSEMERIAQIVEEVESGGSQSRLTRFYSLTAAEPVPLTRALQESFAKASFSADSTSGGIFATASEEDHTAIAKVVDEINAQPTKLPSLKAFVLRHAKVEAVAEAIQSAFGRRSSAGVSFSRDARSVFVVGSRQELLVAEQLVEQLDSAGFNEEIKKLQLFSLAGVDGKAVTTSIESLFKGDSSAVDVRYDALNRQMFVTGTPSQLKLAEEAIKQFSPPARELEIIQLQSADPFSFKMAADSLFQDEPTSNAPMISIDASLQQLVVRATKEQLHSIKNLLKQMGETPTAQVPSGTGRLRFVPVHRNSKKLIEDLQQVWPTLRKNPIKVVEPQSPGQAPPRSAPPLGVRAATPFSKLASTQSTGDPADPQAPNPQQTAGAPSPIIVVTGEDQWTLASDDTEALDLFTRLMDTLMNPRVSPIATTGNFSVYILRHADAEHLRELLVDLFRTGDSNRRNSLSDAIQRVKIVADARINALIIGGNRADRKIVEELLAVFDSEDLLETLQQVSPTIVTLQNASATNVATIVQTVYKSQLSSGAGRQPVDIPEGVTAEVALVLQQLNAQASGPLLTASVDATTNSIILRGPPSLTAEVGSFIQKLDQQSFTSAARRVQLLRLESTNTKNLEKALNLLRAK